MPQTFSLSDLVHWVTSWPFDLVHWPRNLGIWPLDCRGCRWAVWRRYDLTVMAHFCLSFIWGFILDLWPFDNKCYAQAVRIRFVSDLNLFCDLVLKLQSSALLLAAAFESAWENIRRRPRFLKEQTGNRRPRGGEVCEMVYPHPHL